MKPLRWHAQGSFVALVCAKDETKLGFVTTETNDKWSATAVETDGENIGSVFDSHAHQFLGEFDTVSEAFAACETYAAEWRKGKRANECGCEDIETMTLDQRSKRLVSAVVENMEDRLIDAEFEDDPAEKPLLKCFGFYGNDGCGWSGNAPELTITRCCPVCRGGHISVMR